MAWGRPMPTTRKKQKPHLTLADHAAGIERLLGILDYGPLRARVVRDANQGDAHRTSVAQSRGPVLSDLFEVWVGPVVDFRDANKGPWRPYVVAKSLPMWCEVPTVGRRRRFNKRVFTPPFVVVRRMSRPGDTHRVVATLKG